MIQLLLCQVKLRAGNEQGVLSVQFGGGNPLHVIAVAGKEGGHVGQVRRRELAVARQHLQGGHFRAGYVQKGLRQVLFHRIAGHLEGAGIHVIGAGDKVTFIQHANPAGLLAEDHQTVGGDFLAGQEVSVLFAESGILHDVFFGPA